MSLASADDYDFVPPTKKSKRKLAIDDESQDINNESNKKSKVSLAPTLTAETEDDLDDCGPMPLTRLEVSFYKLEYAPLNHC